MRCYSVHRQWEWVSQKSNNSSYLPDKAQRWYLLMDAKAPARPYIYRAFANIKPFILFSPWFHWRRLIAHLFLFPPPSLPPFPFSIIPLSILSHSPGPQEKNDIHLPPPPEFTGALAIVEPSSTATFIMAALHHQTALHDPSCRGGNCWGRRGDKLAPQDKNHPSHVVYLSPRRGEGLHSVLTYFPLFFVYVISGTNRCVWRVYVGVARATERKREREERREEMVLHISPYSSACLHFLDGLSWSLVFPCYWLLDRLLASCVATSLEKRQRSQDPCSFLTLCILIAAPLYLLLLLASLPFALLGFIIWAPLQAVRQPYLYTYRRLVHIPNSDWHA